MGEPSTVKNLRSGEWYLSDFGWQGSYEEWHSSGMPNSLVETRQRVENILTTHKPIPLSEEMESELDQIYKHAQEI